MICPKTNNLCYDSECVYSYNCKDMNKIKPLQLGWQCPNCHIGISPYVKTCPNCTPLTPTCGSSIA